MRRPTARMTPNTVTVVRATFGQDAALGRKPVETPDPTPRPCAVQPTSVDDLPEHMREQEVIYHTVKFYDDPRLSNRDKVIFRGRELVVIGVRGSSGGAGRTWPVLCEEKPIKRKV